MNFVSRFAPSPTGFLHIGNVRTALINYLFTKKHQGQFILRIDDTDKVRSKEEYVDALKEDLTWLGIKWDRLERQSDRIKRYEEIKNKLITMGRIYPCYETPEELDFKRKIQLNAGKPPIYDRASLKLSEEEKQKLEASGKKPHYRFLLKSGKIKWNDLIRGEIEFEADNLSDPILIREDGSMTYILCSAIDDIDFGITHIVRGEDHITNTAIGIQITESLNAPLPFFAHTSLLKSNEGKLSKRVGGFEIRNLREQYIEPLAILSLLARMGSSKPIDIFYSLEDLINEFDIKDLSRATAIYNEEELLRLNQKLLHHLSYEDVKNKIDVTEEFWNAIKDNIETINEVEQWKNICFGEVESKENHAPFLNYAAEILPNQFDETSIKEWLKSIQNKYEVKGKDLFIPLRIAITGMDHGPELKHILPLINREIIIKRLS